MVCSAYSPNNDEESPPPQRVGDFKRDFEANGLDLVISCDANAYHTACKCSDCNNRGEALLEFLGTTNLGVLKFECGPQQKNSKGRASRHLTGFGESGNKDHGGFRKRSPCLKITFDLTDVESKIRLYTNLRKTD